MTRFLPILPLRDIVVFPNRIVPLFVGREKSVAALEAAMADNKELFLVAQLGGFDHFIEARREGLVIRRGREIPVAAARGGEQALGELVTG